MDRYVTAATIKALRERAGLTQAQLAERLCVSDKTVSKWESGRGYPDISLLEPIARQFNITLAQLLSGNTVSNTNLSANVMKTKLYVCPVCGNIVSSVGETAVACHGIELMPLTAEQPDEEHTMDISVIDGEFYLSSSHTMTREHYISFITAVGYKGISTVKLYPEGQCEASFSMRGVEFFLYYCNRDGLFRIDRPKTSKKTTG